MLSATSQFEVVDQATPAGEVARAAPALGASIAFLTPEGMRSLPLPTYPGMRLALARPNTIARRIVDLRPAAITATG